MPMRRTLINLMCAAVACASVLLQAQSNQGSGQAPAPRPGRGQAQGRGPQGPGQPSDEDNKNTIDEVKAGQTGFVTIFDGKSMTGWSVSAKSRHSSTSGNKTGGHWELRDGMIIGSQDIPGNGGLFITDKKYNDFEVVMEMRNDFGVDSGLYLRSNETGDAYQVMIDYRRNGSLAGVYGENMRPGFIAQPFSFLDAPDRIFTTGLDAPDRRFRNTGMVPMPVLPHAWPDFWRHTSPPHECLRGVSAFLINVAEPVTYVSRQLGHKDSAITLAPAFLFVGPYGFKIPAGLLADLMKAGRVELFINVTGGGMDERLERAIPLMARGMEAKWWTSAVRMVTGGQATRYVLLHLTNSDHGRDLMKECAWSVSPAGGFPGSPLGQSRSTVPDQARAGPEAATPMGRRTAIAPS